MPKNTVTGHFPRPYNYLTWLKKRGQRQPSCAAPNPSLQSLRARWVSRVQATLRHRLEVLGQGIQALARFCSLSSTSRSYTVGAMAGMHSTTTPYHTALLHPTYQSNNAKTDISQHTSTNRTSDLNLLLRSRPPGPRFSPNSSLSSHSSPQKQV